MNKLGCVAIGVLSVAACNSDDAPIDIHDLPDSLRSVECDLQVRCEAMPDKPTCLESTLFDSTNELSTIAAVDAGTIIYDGSLAKRCVDLLSGLSCSITDLELAVDPCNAMFVGTVAAGGACFVSEECADKGRCQQTDTTCDSSTACCVGTCVAANPTVPVGGTCGDTTPNCVDGAYCSVPAGMTSGTCKTQVRTAGAACDAPDGCAVPLLCDVNGTHTCKDLPAEGESCTNQGFFPCADLRDFCDPTSLTCTRRIGVGGACSDSGAQCVGFAGCDGQTLKCLARPSLGDTCDDSAVATNCLGDLACDTAGPTPACIAPAAGFTCPM